MVYQLGKARVDFAFELEAIMKFHNVKQFLGPLKNTSA